MKKNSQTKLSEAVQVELVKLYSTTYNGLQSAAEGYLALRSYTINEIKRAQFSKAELVALIDSLNGVMMDASLSCSSSALSA